MELCDTEPSVILKKQYKPNNYRMFLIGLNINMAMKLQYLIKTRIDGTMGLGMAHVWNGEDTLCRMASTGGLMLDKYQLFSHPSEKGICKICEGIMNRIAKQNKVTNINDWAWKPDSDSKSGYSKKTEARYQRKQLKRKKAAEKRKQNQVDGKKKRLELLEYFGLHQYSSWTAIAEMICQETESILPESRKACRSLAIKYVPGEKRKREYKPRMSSEKFYSSTSWREVRYIALKQSGGCCTLCGARASDGITLHVDHIIPRSVNPRKELDLNNLQILCEDCNLGKANRDEIDHR